MALLLQQRRSLEANQPLHDVWPFLGWYTICTISGALAPDGILPGAKFTFRPSLAFSYIGSVTARHSSSGVSQTLRRGTRNGITELSQKALPIFGWAAITLGIDPHCSLFFFTIDVIIAETVIRFLDRITSTTYVDAVYCYLSSSVVCQSVCHTSEPCKND